MEVEAAILEAVAGFFSSKWKLKQKQINFTVVEAEAASFKKLEAEAEALHAELEAEAITNSPLPHHWFKHT